MAAQTGTLAKEKLLRASPKGLDKPSLEPLALAQLCSQGGYELFPLARGISVAPFIPLPFCRQASSLQLKARPWIPRKYAMGGNLI